MQGQKNATKYQVAVYSDPLERSRRSSERFECLVNRRLDVRCYPQRESALPRRRTKEILTISS